MPGLTASDLLDLVSTTQPDLGEDKWTDISYDLQEYHALPNILQKEKVGFKSGRSIQFGVQYRSNGSARMKGFYETDSPANLDTMTNGEIPFKQTDAHYIMDVTEIAMNSGKRQIRDLLKSKKHARMVDIAKLAEAQFWGKPSDSTDTDDIFGVQYWFPFGTSTTPGQQAIEPSGFSAGRAGLLSATYGEWDHLAAVYSTVSSTDAIRRMRECHTKAMFKPPVKVAEYNTGDRYGIYMNYETLALIEEIAMSNNDRNTYDVANSDGNTTFRKTQLHYVPFLDAHAQDPIYGFNWGVFKPFFLEGRYMVEETEKSPTQHTAVVSYLDMVWNIGCTDLRRNFVVNKAA